MYGFWPTYGFAPCAVASSEIRSLLEFIQHLSLLLKRFAQEVYFEQADNSTGTGIETYKGCAGRWRF